MKKTVVFGLVDKLKSLNHTENISKYLFVHQHRGGNKHAKTSILAQLFMLAIFLF